MSDELPRISDAGASLVALSSDSPENAADVSSRDSLAFPVIPDTRLEVARAFGVRQAGKHSALPATFVLSEDGKIVFAYVGVEADDRPGLDEVLSALAE